MMKLIIHKCMLLILAMCLLTSINSDAQTTANNYIVTYSPRIAISTASSIPGNTVGNVNQTVQYFDGLGRPVQTVQTKASPSQRDIVQPMAYDQYDREAVKYLPYTDSAASSNYGTYKTTALADQAAFYAAPNNTKWYAPGVVQTGYASGSTRFEPSPLNRPLEQGFPGQSWQLSTSGVSGSGHTMNITYASNNASSLTSGTGYWAKQFAVTYLYNAGAYIYKNALADQGSYTTDVLSVTISKDENWSSAQTNLNLNTTQEYKDKFGRIVLKRTFNYNTATSTNETLSTYYVYDGFGNLTYVLPPGANPDAGGITQNILDNLCYQYRYDGRHRIIEKKIPGKGWDMLIYNNLNQVIATQDSVQRMDNPQQVSYIKYDAQGRAIITGYYTISGTIGVDYRTTLQSAANAQTLLWETKSSGGAYSNLTIPISSATVLSVNYYDDYNIPGLPAAYASPTSASTMTRGLLTATQTAVLNTPADMLWTAHYYDNLGRVVKGYAQHYLGGHTSYSTNNYDAVTNLYNFTNQLDTTIRQHYKAAALKVTVTNIYDYDQVGRRLHNTEQITGSNGVAQAGVYLSFADYNELGQLYNKNIDGTPGNGLTANVTLGSANSLTSGQTLNVTAADRITIESGFTAAPGSTFTTTIGGYLQTFNYKYNERGWLTNLTPVVGGNFAETLAYNYPAGSALPQYNGNISQFNYNSPNMATHYSQAAGYINTVNYTYDNLNRLTQSQSSLAQSDETVSYDMMGNIKTLARNGPAVASMAYTYLNSGQSNQLSAVSNNSTSYRTYSYDGNGNALSDGGLSGAAKSISYNLLNLPQIIQSGGTTITTYYYGADGNKLRNTSTAFGNWDYIGGIVYLNGQIKFIQTEEGKASLYSDSITYKYSYDFKDYLGNVRASYDNGGTGSTLRYIQEDDYYPFGLSQLYYDNSNGNKYLYNGKEQQYDLANQYDYGARFYDPVIARWTTVDLMSEKERRWSPYNYVANCPIRNIDPDGMEDVNLTGEAAQNAFVSLRQQVDADKKQQENISEFVDNADFKYGADASIGNDGAGDPGYVGHLVNWFNLMLYESKYTKGGDYAAYSHIDRSSTHLSSGEFVKDATDTKLLKTAISYAVKRLGTGPLVALLKGLGVVPDKNYQAQEFVTMLATWNLADVAVQDKVVIVTADAERWYGKVQYNGTTGQLTAVQYDGSEKNAGSGVHRKD